VLDLGKLRVNDRVRLRRAVSGHDAGAVGTVVKTLTAHEPDGKTVPAVIVAWDTPRGRSRRVTRVTREVFTQHEQAVHWILDRAERISLSETEQGLW
jgi:hypothetical protein